MAGVVKQFVSHVMPGVLKPLRVLWNEIIGFFFIVFGVWFAGSAIRGYQKMDQATDGGLLRVIAPGIGALVMLGYGLYSFLRARKISRS